MVKMLRVDERLLHGQVAVTWVSSIGPEAILIANDEIMDNEMAKMALKMAKPTGINLAIRSIDEGAKLLNDPRSQEIGVFVIVRNIADAVRLAKQTDAIKHVNIGGVKKKEGGKLIAAAVYVNDDDIAKLRELQEITETVEFRMVPADSAKSLKDVLNNL